MPYTAGIGQGNTNSASDCVVFYNNLASQYGSSNVLTAGFNPSTGAILSNLADVDNFIYGKNLNVLYWSSHGDSTPKLNYGDSTEFQSGMTAYNYWRNTANPLKVAIFAACYQFDGNTNRSRWANNIMRQTDIRAMAGYHETGPTDPYDANIATKFFELCDDGNSVLYSWQHANAITSRGDDWLVLVYYDDGRRYYRLPGYPGSTYPNPDRTNTKIYRYASTISNQEVPKTTRLANLVPTSVNTVPYTLDICEDTCKSIDASPIKPVSTICTDKVTHAMFYKVRENSSKAVSSDIARSHNLDFLNPIISDASFEGAYINTYDDTMAEVLVDTDKEGPESIIGSTTRVFQQHDGILLEENCIVSSSDADGVIGLSSQWLATKVRNDVDHIDLAHRDLSALTSKVSKLSRSSVRCSTISAARPVYVRIGSKFILHYEVDGVNGYRECIDAKDIDKG